MKEEASPVSPPVDPPAVIGYATPESNRRRHPVPAARWMRFWRCHPVDIGLIWVFTAMLLFGMSIALDDKKGFGFGPFGNATLLLVLFFPIYVIMTCIICWEYDKPERRV